MCDTNCWLEVDGGASERESTEEELFNEIPFAFSGRFFQNPTGAKSGAIAAPGTYLQH